MHIGYLISIASFTLAKYYAVVCYFVKKFFVDLFWASSDIIGECQSKYVYLRPSEVRYNSDYFTRIATKKWDGSKTTIYDEIAAVVWRNKSVRSISRQIVVVKREDNRGSSKYQRRSQFTRQPGWWVVSGNELLWVLRTLEKLRYIEYAQFSALRAMANERFYAKCDVTRESNGGWDARVGFGSVGEQEELNDQVEKILLEYRKSIKPVWNRTHSIALDTRMMRLSDYEKPTGPRNTRSCTSGGVCHMTLREYNREKIHYLSPEEMDENHACMRPVPMGTSRVTPRYKHAYDGVIDWKAMIWGFICILLVGFLGGCLSKGCGCIVGRAIQWDKLSKDPPPTQ